MNGGEGNIRYSPLSQINRSNVRNLQVAWTYDSQDAFKDSEMQSNPIVVDGVLFATTPTMKVVAVNAETGREIWKFDPSGGAKPRTRFRHRGVTVHADRVFVSYRSFLWALDKATGQPIPSFGDNGRIDMREGLGRPADEPERQRQHARRGVRGPADHAEQRAGNPARHARTHPRVRREDGQAALDLPHDSATR